MKTSDSVGTVQNPFALGQYNTEAPAVWDMLNKTQHDDGAWEVTSQVWTLVHSRPLEEEGVLVQQHAL